MPTILKTKNSVTTTVVPTTLQQGELAVNITDKKLWVGNAATTPVQLLGAGVTGDVVGPASATDNAVARFDATTGKLIQNSLVTVSDTGAISAPVDASISGLTVGKGRNQIANNTAFGLNALASASLSGDQNVGIGNTALFANTTGGAGTAIGMYALALNTTGNYNTGLGHSALYNNTTASNNTAVGYQAGYSGVTAANNTFVGWQAGYTNTGDNNTGLGYAALKGNTSGIANTAVGLFAAFTNTTGGSNAVLGQEALRFNTTGSNNTAIGRDALWNNTTASNNTAVGYQAGYSQTTAASEGQNTFVGRQSGYNTTGSLNSFFGSNSGVSVTSGTRNTIIGQYTGNNGGLDIRTESNNIVLSDGDGNIRLYTNASGFTKITDGGGTAILGRTGTYHEIFSTQNASPALIVVNNGATYNNVALQVDVTRNTTNGTFQAIGYYNRTAAAWRMYVQDSGNLQNVNNSYGAISDIKLKENIIDATPKLDKLMQVKVRNYNLKADQTHKQIGVIAQELEDVFPSLIEEFVDKDGDGNDLGTKTKAVKYSVFVPMLIKAMQELNAKVDAQALEIATLKGN